MLEEVVGGAVQTRYTYGTSIVSETRDVSMTPTTSYYGFDAHSNITFLTNAAGSVTDSYDLDTFGILIASTGSTPNTRLYAGEELDPHLGLINLRARQYDPSSGRFLTLDPLDINVDANASSSSTGVVDAIADRFLSRFLTAPTFGLQRGVPSRHGQFLTTTASILGRYTSPLTFNRYIYANGDPMTFVDRTGFAFDIAWESADWAATYQTTKTLALVIASALMIAVAGMIWEEFWDEILKEAGTKEEWHKAFQDPWKQWGDCWKKMLKFLAKKTAEKVLEKFPQSLSKEDVRDLLRDGKDLFRKCLTDPPGGAN